ncbi:MULTISPECIES: WGR domain-containing protein [Rhodobacterales]|jgi:predicted DNA-binding WGR domain protein|uniref:WGR domain-containing protein n=2 Tax=Phaeobacter gallaeciensis TaxID=60890 RepID=A0AAW6L8F4_9RHOB|nr:MULTISPECIES: WGR domain-containing protein [Phaeobacter]MDF1773292.1 WGR domain-containing protein [Pseudophaeobacter sp. bin_em_oilr2.035]MEC9312861.1 WGR domain-containing protein [Pseudomonadota bacterium]MDE4060997.1 WGR domain-containing protein [Phaeobacter gallaeciensis]MDE4124016.1 WGR domain-containing protein [Phaeobacter gallaeciensis]MDE4128486.1 WGR domain-containing protein [Phaeobacter gallaeciensis]
MATCLLYRETSSRPSRFYRIELAMNLFSEVSVLREWGVAGRDGQSVINIYGNLREASVAADSHRNRMIKRGYNRDGLASQATAD